MTVPDNSIKNLELEPVKTTNFIPHISIQTTLWANTTTQTQTTQLSQLTATMAGNFSKHNHRWGTNLVVFMIHQHMDCATHIFGRWPEQHQMLVFGLIGSFYVGQWHDHPHSQSQILINFPAAYVGGEYLDLRGEVTMVDANTVNDLVEMLEVELEVAEETMSQADKALELRFPGQAFSQISSQCKL